MTALTSWTHTHTLTHRNTTCLQSMHNYGDLSHPLWHLSSRDDVPHRLPPATCSVGFISVPTDTELGPSSELAHASFSFIGSCAVRYVWLYLLSYFIQLQRGKPGSYHPQPTAPNKSQDKDKKHVFRDFPDSPVVKSWTFHYTGHRFNPWFVIKIPHVSVHGQNNNATKYWIYSMTFLPIHRPSQVQTSLNIPFRVFFISKKLGCTDRHP